MGNAPFTIIGPDGVFVEFFTHPHPEIDNHTLVMVEIENATKFLKALSIAVVHEFTRLQIGDHADTVGKRDRRRHEIDRCWNVARLVAHTTVAFTHIEPVTKAKGAEPDQMGLSMPSHVADQLQELLEDVYRSFGATLHPMH